MLPSIFKCICDGETGNLTTCSIGSICLQRTFLFGINRVHGRKTVKFSESYLSNNNSIVDWWTIVDNVETALQTTKTNGNK